MAHTDDRDALDFPELSALVLPGSSRALVPVEDVRALLRKYFNDRVISRARKRRQLRSFAEAGLLRPTQERPFYGLLCCLFHYFSDTIIILNCEASILCFPQPRFFRIGDDDAPLQVDDDDDNDDDDDDDDEDLTVAEPSASSAPQQQPVPTPEPAVSDGESQAKADTNTSNDKEKDCTDYRDPDFAQYLFVHHANGSVTKTLGNWVEAKPRPRPQRTKIKDPEDVYLLSLFVQDMTQLEEQEALARLQYPNRETFVSFHTREHKFTGIEWRRNNASISEATTLPDQAETADSSASADPERDGADSAIPIRGHDIRELPSKEMTAVGASATSNVPSQSASATPTTTARKLMPVDPNTFQGTSWWVDDQSAELLKCANQTKEKFLENRIAMHGRSLPFEAGESLRKRYNKAVTATALVDMHPRILYYNADMLAGSGDDLRASHQFTNALRLAHSGLVDDMSYEHSDLFPVFDHERHYKPSEEDNAMIMLVMAQLYWRTLEREWGQKFEDARIEAEKKKKSGTGSAESSYVEGDSLGSDDTQDYGYGPKPTPNQVNDLLKHAGPDANPYVPPAPGLQEDNSPSTTVPAGPRVHFADDVLTTTEAGPSVSARPVPRYRTRAHQAAFASVGSSVPLVDAPAAVDSSSLNMPGGAGPSRTGGRRGGKDVTAATVSAKSGTQGTLSSTTRNTLTARTAAGQFLDTQAKTSRRVGTRNADATSALPSASGGEASSVAGPSRSKQAGYAAKTKASRAKEKAAEEGKSKSTGSRTGPRAANANGKRPRDDDEEPPRPSGSAKRSRTTKR